MRRRYFFFSFTTAAALVARSRAQFGEIIVVVVVVVALCERSKEVTTLLWRWYIIETVYDDFRALIVRVRRGNKSRNCVDLFGGKKNKIKLSQNMTRRTRNIIVDAVKQRTDTNHKSHWNTCRFPQ